MLFEFYIFYIFQIILAVFSMYCVGFCKGLSQIK